MQLTRVMLLCLTVLSASALAEVKTFASARLLEQQKTEVDHYRLVVSELKRTQATTYGEQEKRLNGELWRRIWAVDSGFSLAEVSDYFQRQLSAMEVIYQCQGLDCGSSHFWANKIFSYGRLVGREQHQHYWVAKRTLPNNLNELWVLYLVQRGSKQVYIAMDRFITADEISLQQVSREQIQAALRQNAGWLPGLVVDNGMLDEEQSANLIDVLRSLPGRDKRRLYLMTHCYDASLMSDNLLCSERLAKQLRVATFDSAAELNILGQGALVAAPDDGLMPKVRYIFWPQR